MRTSVFILNSWSYNARMNIAALKENSVFTIWLLFFQCRPTLGHFDTKSDKFTVIFTIHLTADHNIVQ